MSISFHLQGLSKTKTTQILCKNKVFECPNYISGWDINVVTAQEAVGYVGTALNQAPIQNAN